MQIKGLHKNIYRLYAYFRTQECLDVYRNQYQGGIDKWEKLKAAKVSDKLAREMAVLT